MFIVMDERTLGTIVHATHWPRIALASALFALMMFLLAGTASSLRSMHYIGAGITPTNTISVSGEGEVFAIPDIAEFTFSISETAKDVQTAQTNATKKTNSSIAYLKKHGIEEKDIKTIDYSVNPHYEWQQSPCLPVADRYVPCPSGKQILVGYDVSQTVQVKVRETKRAGDLLAGVGDAGATNISGLNFTVEDQKKLEEEARGKAIAEARARAEALADELGVDLVRVVSFNEGGGIRPYYAKTMSSMSMDAVSEIAPAPEIPVGQNKITSSVTVTYEIR